MKLVSIATKKVTWKPCFSKRDDDQLSKLAKKCTAAMADHLSTYNKEAMDTIVNKLESLFLKGKG